MGSLSLTKKCRPIRLGFLVRPGSQTDLRRAAEINTIMWGGLLNPLIPFYQRVPATWGDRILGRPSAVEILRGYIATFQPDFLVKPDELSLSAGIFPHDRVLNSADVVRVPRPGEYVASVSPVTNGLDMMDVYRDAYRRVHRFMQRHPRNYLIPALRGKLRLLGDFLWGAFPAESELAYYRRNYVEIFQAEEKTYDALSSLLPGTGTPLDITLYRLEAGGRAPDPCVFLFDASKPIDLIDFWNLRACGGLCIPLPISMVGILTPEITKFMVRHLRRRAINDTQLTYPHLIGSRSLDETAVRSAIELLGLDAQYRLVQGPYPRLWAKQEASWDQSTPASFHYEDELRHIDAESERLRFDAMQPDFAARFGRSGPRWMNVISLTEYHPERLPASVIPDGIEHLGPIVDHFSSRPGIWANDEGIAIPCEHKNWEHRWTVPDASKIGQEWAQSKGYKLAVSDSGHVLQSMVEVAGGLFRGRWFANIGIIRALGRMAEGHAVFVGKFQQAVKTAYDRASFLHGSVDRHLAYFKDRAILRLCVKIQCPHCRQYPWYVLEDLAHHIKCSHCLRDFAFPIAKPLKTWGYRSVGPFASAGYAKGAYSTFLALRFLSDQLEAQTTCVPSAILAKDGQECEVDFICFWQKESWRGSSRHVIFGECKSFDDFEEKDISRMKEISRRFPGSIIAFCTLKNKLSAREKRLIADFAEIGRRPRKGISWPIPVLVLTAHELCVMTPNEFYHRCLAGDGQGLAAWMPRGDIGMSDLCDASQQEHLGLSSWYDWIDRFYKKSANSPS